MTTRRTSYMVIVAVVSALMLAPGRGAAVPPETDLESIPVEVAGALSPDGRFVGTLTIERVTMVDAGRLLLTGILYGTATQRTGSPTEVRHQAFTAPAVPVKAEQTTDVVLLKMAPIALASVGRQLTLAPVPLDIEAIPDESLLFPTLLN
jgi:hypothetical protein